MHNYLILWWIVIAVQKKFEHLSWSHTHNCFTALWILSGTTWVSWYQKKHSPKHERSHIYYKIKRWLPVKWRLVFLCSTELCSFCILQRTDSMCQLIRSVFWSWSSAAPVLIDCLFLSSNWSELGTIVVACCILVAVEFVHECWIKLLVFIDVLRFSEFV